jgi:hypothetical protein
LSTLSLVLGCASPSSGRSTCRRSASATLTVQQHVDDLRKVCLPLPEVALDAQILQSLLREPDELRNRRDASIVLPAHIQRVCHHLGEEVVVHLLHCVRPQHRAIVLHAAIFEQVWNSMTPAMCRRVATTTGSPATGLRCYLRIVSCRRCALPAAWNTFGLIGSHDADRQQSPKITWKRNSGLSLVRARANARVDELPRLPCHVRSSSAQSSEGAKKVRAGY